MEVRNFIISKKLNQPPPPPPLQKKNGFKILEQEGMAHRQPSEHRERLEGGAEARRRRQEVGRATQTDRRGARAFRVPPSPGASWPRPVSNSILFLPSFSFLLGLGFLFFFFF